MKPSVSVIITSYNRAGILKRAINCVLAQNYTDFELLVIDDGSEDETAELVDGLGDERIRYIRHPVNLGFSAALNTGIKSAEGEYIAFLDSDDEWLPNKLFEQINFMRSAPNQEAGCVTWFFREYEGSRKLVAPETKDTLPKYILYHNRLHMGTTLLIRRAIAEEIGPFDTQLLRGQDTDWMFRLTSRYALGIIAKPLAVFYRDTNRSAVTLERATHILRDKYLNELRGYGMVYFRTKDAASWRNLAFQYSLEGNRTKSREYASKSVLANPFQPPGIYLMLLDALLGTKFKEKANYIKQQTLSIRKH